MKYRAAFMPPNYHTPWTMPVHPKIIPSDFRIVPAAGVFIGDLRWGTFHLPAQFIGHIIVPCTT